MKNLCTDIRCRHCGYRGRDHRDSDGRCPGGVEPRWPRSVKNEEKASRLYDERLLKHWAARTTTFEPSTL